MRKAMSLEAKFWRHVIKTDSCWLWSGRVNRNRGGYGCLNHQKKTLSAHRVSMLLHGKPIPDNMFSDHVCRNRLCVNPEHLRAVTPKQNTLENSIAVTAINARKTECKRGHKLPGPWKRGWRVCKLCQRIYDRRYKSKFERHERP